YAVNDREFDVRIIHSDLLHYRSLGKTDADNQVKILFRECPHRRFDRCRISRFDVVKTDVQILFGAFDAFPRGGIERPVVLSADVENDADACRTTFAALFDRSAAGCRKNSRGYYKKQQCSGHKTSET